MKTAAAVKILKTGGLHLFGWGPGQGIRPRFCPPTTMKKTLAKPIKYMIYHQTGCPVTVNRVS